MTAPAHTERRDREEMPRGGSASGAPARGASARGASARGGSAGGAADGASGFAADQPAADQLVAAASTVRFLNSRRARRTAALLATLVVVLLAVVVARVLLGRYTVSAVDFVRILGGETIPGAGYIVLDQRLPRVALGVGVGLAFGAAGALFRRVLGNPLASPDILGISYGASAGAVFGMAVWGASGGGVAPFAFVGSVAALVLILVGSVGRGGIRTRAFLLSGIGVSMLCVALTTQLIARMPLQNAHDGYRWIVGSLGLANSDTLVMLAVVLPVLLALAAWLHHAMSVSELGDELAGSLGTRPAVLRAAALATGTTLAAVATAAAGPLAFVALLATPIATAVGGGRPRILAAALVGAILVVGADFVAAEALADIDLPTGVVTGAIGAPAMLWLLIRSRKEIS